MKLGLFLVRIFIMSILYVLNIVAHIVALCLPVGLYVLLLQLRSKCSVISSLSAYAPPESTWQFIYPNTIIVTTTPKLLKTNINKLNKRVTEFCIKWKTLLISSSVITLLTLLTIIAYTLVKHGV